MTENNIINAHVPVSISDLNPPIKGQAQANLNIAKGALILFHAQILEKLHIRYILNSIPCIKS